jgi:hypothetical protein
MELTRPLVEEKAREYRETEPFDAVEREHAEVLSGTFRGGEFGWRDVEWVVQWYYRRYRGAYPDEDRRAAEASVRENDFDDVAEVLAAVEGDRETDERIELLTSLAGIDVPVAAAFLTFLFPDRYVAIDERVWGVLHEAGELDRPYPEDPAVDDYLAFNGTCRDLETRLDVEPWTLYRALWRLGKDE